MSVVRAGGSSRCMPVSRVDRLCRSEPQAWETSHGPGYDIRGIRYEQRDTCGGDCPGRAGSSAAFHCAPLRPVGPRGGRGGEGELEEGGRSRGNSDRRAGLCGRASRSALGLVHVARRAAGGAGAIYRGAVVLRSSRWPLGPAWGGRHWTFPILGGEAVMINTHARANAEQWPPARRPGDGTRRGRIMRVLRLIRDALK